MTYTYKLARRLAMWWVVSCTLGFLLVAVAVPAEWLSAVLQDAAALVIEVRLGLSFLPHPHIPPGLAQLFVIWFGSVAGYVFKVLGDFEGAKDFLRQVLPNRSKAFYTRLDLLVSSTMGSMLGMIIVNPTTMKAQLLTGLAWPLLVRAAVGAARAMASQRSSGDDLVRENVNEKLLQFPQGPRGPVEREAALRLPLTAVPELPPAA